MFSDNFGTPSYPAMRSKAINFQVNANEVVTLTVDVSEDDFGMRNL